MSYPPYIKVKTFIGRYSLLSKDVENELFPCLRKLKIRFYAYNPLQGGLLACKFDINDLPVEGRFRTDSKQGQKYRARFWKAAYFEAITIYKQACLDLGLSPVEVALKWMVHHSELNFKSGDAIIIGASSQKQYLENIDALESVEKLPQSLLNKIDECWFKVVAIAPPYGR